MVGGVSSELQGASFGSGFASAGFSELAGPLTENLDSNLAQVATSALIGGTASRLSGGKFANGALTGAMGWAFNNALHREQSDPYDGLSGSEKSALARKVLSAGANYRKGMAQVQRENPFLLAAIIEYSYADGISAADLSLEMDLDLMDLSASLMSIESDALSAISTGERIKWYGNGVGPTAGLIFDVVSGGVKKSIPTLNWMSRTKMGYEVASKMLSSNDGVYISCTVSNGCSWSVEND